MTHKLTDDQVSELPLSQARADLLEEILAAAPERGAVRVLAPRRTRWVVPAAAAAAVAALAVPAWLVGAGEDVGPGLADAPTTSPTSAPTTAGTTSGTTVPAPDTPHEWVLLPVEGWVPTYVSDAYGAREVQYEKGRERLSITLSAARHRQSYVEDRSGIDYPEIDPGTPVSLLGEEALLWPYSPLDHTTIGAVDGKVYPEVRGSGMDRDAYLALLDALVWVDAATFQASLPGDRFVSDATRDLVVAKMMGDMAVPAGFDQVRTAELDRYQLGARVSGAVACAWLDQYAAARGAGDAAAAREAEQALAGSRDWAVLHEMDARGDYPEVLWEYADAVSAGRVPEGYDSGLGCR